MSFGKYIELESIRPPDKKPPEGVPTTKYDLFKQLHELLPKNFKEYTTAANNSEDKTFVQKIIVKKNLGGIKQLNELEQKIYNQYQLLYFLNKIMLSYEDGSITAKVFAEKAMELFKELEIVNDETIKNAFIDPANRAINQLILKQKLIEQDIITLLEHDLPLIKKHIKDRTSPVNTLHASLELALSRYRDPLNNSPQKIEELKKAIRETFDIFNDSKIDNDIKAQVMVYKNIIIDPYNTMTSLLDSTLRQFQSQRKEGRYTSIQDKVASDLINTSLERYVKDRKDPYKTLPYFTQKEITDLLKNIETLEKHRGAETARWIGPYFTKIKESLGYETTTRSEQILRSFKQELTRMSDPDASEGESTKPH